MMQARLIRLDNNEMIIIDKPVYRIGREKSHVDYCIPNSVISRCHCNIISRTDGFYLLDCHSTNRTYINGVCLVLATEVLLHHGDEVRLANLYFRFEEVH